MGKKRWHRETEADREALWPLSPEERYISVDIEADGPVPGPHSMLSLGAAAYNAWGQQVGKFSANLETLPDATTDDGTMAWWEGQPEAWKRARERPREPATVMEDFHLFALGDGPRRSGRPVMVTYPAAFDAMWVTWYLHAFTSGDPFRRRCIDLKTLAMQLLGGGYANAAKRNMPPELVLGKAAQPRRRPGCHRTGRALRQHRRGAPGGAAGAVRGPCVVRRPPGCRPC